MSKSKKKILILLTLVIFFIFSNISKNFITNNQSLEFNEKDQVQINQSGFWDLTGNPIYIDDSATGVGAHNWTWAETQPWCSGSGSWADPYVIENVTIDRQDSVNCIEIWNSDAYFIIRNCSLNNSGDIFNNDGIKLDNVDNGKIINNICSENNNYGINLWDSYNNTLSGNTANNNYRGILLGDSYNNTLSGNTANNNNNRGILLMDSDNNTLSGNTANYNIYGIDLWSSDNNTLSGNTASNNDDVGIWIDSGNNNTLSGNTANNNSYGISLSSSNNNTLSGNKMDFCGISLSGSLTQVASHSIDNTNLVNNKPVYYYTNEIGLGSINFPNAGQIILINCSNSIISGLDLSNGTTGIYLGYSNNNTLSGNTADNNEYGIYLYYSNNNTLSGNTANNNSQDIFLYYSNNNTLLGNTASFIKYRGIGLSSSHYNTISNNNLTRGTFGISLESSHYNTISNNNVSENDYGMHVWDSNYNNFTKNSILNITGLSTPMSYYGGTGISLIEGNNNSFWNNTFSYNDYCGISLYGVNNVSIKGNHFENCGLVISGSLNPQVKYDIDQTNLVNNKPIYFYLNKTNLNNGNFTNAGQIFLVNCNDSLIADIEFSYCSSGISLWHCFNNTIFNNTAFNSYHQGISISNCKNISVSQNNVSNCIGYGIEINTANHINLSKNSVDNCMQGINMVDCNNTIISNNLMINNTQIALYSTYYSQKIENITITGNIMNGSGLALLMDNIEETTYNIDQSNLVNGKILYYYINEKSLTHNSFTNAGQIYMYNCSDISFSDLDLSRSTAGLIIYNCNNLTISNIDSSYNSWAGVVIFNCNNSKFSELTIKNTSTNYGLYLSNSYDTIISNSTITDNNYYAFSLYNCLNLTLAGNYFDNNVYGINLQSCSNSTFLGNIIANNSQYGIYIDSWGESENNTFFLNNFFNNEIDAEDNGDNNRWDDGFTGNYWDDYSGADINPIDGIGDTSYLILGTAGKSDFKPLKFPIYEDTDGDWLINYEEYILGDDNYRTNVTNSDSDYDGLSDYWEWRNSTNPWEPDSDFDNMPDGWEVFNSLNPLYDDAFNDPDIDLLLNLYEYGNGTDPQNPDSDFDNMPDGWEVFNSLNPLYDDAFNDTDNDLLENIYEYHNGTNPQNNDTESDGMPDGWEVINGLLPLADDSTGDPDGDNLFNVDEFLSGTNPHNDDTDSDTFLDGIEVSIGTDPLNEWWYPMPNLAVMGFRADNVTEGLPFVLDFTIINNGIWRAEGIVIIIRIDTLDLTLYNNTANPISLDEDESRHIFYEVSSLTSAGQFILNITIDPGNLINETYSLKDGNLRENWKTDNSELYTFGIAPGGGDGTGGLDELLTWIIIGIILAVAFAASISFFLVVARPKLRRRAAAKRLIKSAKDDVRNFEIDLHSFVKSRLRDNYKSIWWEEGVPEYIKQNVDNKINAIQPKKLDRTLDKIDFLDFTHYNAIITDEKNWEPIFSDIFSDKTVVETNLESISVFKRNLYAGNVTPEEMSNYSLFIYTISSYFARGFNIFLSYSTLDTDHFRIKEVANRLESYPRINKVFFWEEDSQENIVVYMEKTLQISKVFVFFCSQYAVKSKAVADEWQAAFQMRKKGMMKIVPVYEKEELIPNLLMPLLNVEYTKDDFDGFIQKLYDEILR